VVIFGFEIYRNGKISCKAKVISEKQKKFVDVVK
jgi:hypothetical protein